MKKEISMKKGILFLSLLLVFLLSCGKKTEIKEYEVVKVERGDISLSTEKTGQVVSDNEISVYTTSSQRVQKVFFKKGDNVKKGDVVMTFYPVDKNETLRKIQIKSLEVQQKKRDLRNASELFKVGGASKVSIDDARIALETAQLELSTLQEDLSLIKNEIVSPVDGVITEMTADENYRVNTETTLFKVSDIKNMKVEVSLSDSQIKNVAVGQRVEITSDSLPDGEKVEMLKTSRKANILVSHIDKSSSAMELKLYVHNAEDELKKEVIYKNVDEYEEKDAEEILPTYAGIFTQNETDNIENNVVRFFVYTDMNNWGFYVVPVQRHGDQLYLGKKQYFPYEDNLNEISYFDGEH